jgi:hypothetical protein
MSTNPYGLGPMPVLIRAKPFCQIICLNHPHHSIFIEGLNLNVVTTTPKISNAKAEPIALIRH